MGASVSSSSSSSSTMFDGYLVSSTETPQNVLFGVGIAVSLLILVGPLSVWLSSSHPTTDPSRNDERGRKETRNHHHTEERVRTALADTSTIIRRAAYPHYTNRAPSTVSTAATTEQRPLSTLLPESSVLWSQLERQEHRANTSSSNRHDDDDHAGDDLPSTTEHHANTTLAPPLRSRWYPKSRRRRSVLETTTTSTVSAPLPDTTTTTEQQQQQSQQITYRHRAVLSEAAAGSMILGSPTKENKKYRGGANTIDDDDEDAVIYVDADDVAVRSHMPMDYTPAAARQYYYDYDDEERSAMPPLSPDAVSPEDAADAHDTGRLVRYPTTVTTTTTTTTLSSASNTKGKKPQPLDTVLDVVNPYFENRRILALAWPIVVGEVAEPVFRLIMVGLIGHLFLEVPNAAAAFVLVHLLLQCSTKDAAGAILDVESNLVQDSILLGGQEGLFLAGQSIQLGMFLQLFVSLLLLAPWWVATEPVVEWLLLDDGDTAGVAASYARIIAADYIIRNVSRALFLPMHMMNQGQWEYVVDTLASCVTFAGVVVVALRWPNKDDDDSSMLDVVGWVQVSVSGAALLFKLLWVKAQGVTKPYEKGFLASITILYPKAVYAFTTQSIPLFVGSILERREWDIFIVLVRFVGSAEVIAWAFMGIFWDIFTCCAESLGEAASTRVSFYLTSGFPDDARLLANKVILFAMTIALAIASTFLLFEPVVAVLLTPDSTLEHLLLDLIGVVGLANAAMVFSQVYASLLSALGEYGKATMIVFWARWLVILPLSLVAVLYWNYDLRALAAAVSLGYALASAVAACTALHRDWHQSSWDMVQQQSELDALVGQSGRDGRHNGGDEERGEVDHQYYDAHSFDSGSDIDASWIEHKADNVTLSSTALTSQVTERLEY